MYTYRSGSWHPSTFLPDRCNFNSIHEPVISEITAVFFDGGLFVPFPTGVSAYLFPVFVFENGTHVLYPYLLCFLLALLDQPIVGLPMLFGSESERVGILESEGTVADCTFLGFGSPFLAGLSPFRFRLRECYGKCAVLVDTHSLTSGSDDRSCSGGTAVHHSIFVSIVIKSCIIPHLYHSNRPNNPSSFFVFSLRFLEV